MCGVVVIKRMVFIMKEVITLERGRGGRLFAIFIVCRIITVVIEERILREKQTATI